MSTADIIRHLANNQPDLALQQLNQCPEMTPELAQLQQIAERFERIQLELLPASSSTAQAAAQRESRTCRRPKMHLDISDSTSANQALEKARHLLLTERYLDGIDIFEQLMQMIPEQAVPLLAELYDHYQKLPGGRNRYSLYVARDFDFRIQSGDKVLDIGSGHDPFPFATHLADFAPEDDHYGRAGVPLKQIAGKPFFHCSVEDMPFQDKEFDFLYCSHVLEHVTDPEKACSEIMRVAKRGYIETPTRGKDLWLNSAGISNHNWAIENRSGTLIFVEYNDEDRAGLGCDILMNMHCAPETPREKAFSALVWLKSAQVNTTLYWENAFTFEICRNRK